MTRRFWLPLKSYDTATEDGRHRERYHRAVLTTLSSAFSRGTSLAVVFASLRIALPYLGEARFGVWMTISSLTTVLMIFDFGIGNGMVSRVAGLVARSDWLALRRLITFGLVLLSLSGILIGGALAYAVAYAPVAWLYRGASHELIEEARGALVLLSVLFGLSIPLQTVHRIYAGLQEGYFSQTIAGFMSLLSLLLLPILPRLHANIADFLLVTYGLQLASGAISLLALHKRFKLATPRFADFRVNDVRAMLGIGGLFFLLQIAGVIGWDMDTVLISTLIGPASVAVYSVAQQMFLLVTGPLSMVNSPLWGGYADAHTRGDVRYIRTTLRRSLLGTLGLATIGVVVLLIFVTPISHLLTRNTLQLPETFVLIFGAWTIVSATGGALAMYLNGVHILVPQVMTSVAFLIVAIALKLVLISSRGLDGVIAGTLMSYLLTIVLPYLTVFRRAISAPLRAP